MQVRNAYPALRQAGATALAITPSQSDVLARHAASRQWPFAIVGDPARQAYQEFGLERTSFWSFFRARALPRYLRLLFRGWLPRLPVAGEDVLQLGGDFVLDRDLRLRFAYRSADASDRPSISRLIEEVRKIAAPTLTNVSPGGGG